MFPGIGILANVLGIVGGGLLGLGCGRLISERFQKTLMMACAVAVMFLGLTGTVKEMLEVGADGKILLVGTNCMLASLIGGALLGEAIDLEDKMERFGIWLRRRTGSSGDTRFVDGFVTASLTVCIGAMAVGIFQGTIFLLAGFLEPVMTPAALKSLSAVGNILIFCVGTNLFGLPHVRVANLLPALVIAVVWVL